MHGIAIFLAAIAVGFTVFTFGAIGYSTHEAGNEKDAKVLLVFGLGFIVAGAFLAVFG